jgi:ATP-binding cassette, subfamily F, member 3
MAILTFDNLSQAYGGDDVFIGLDGRILDDSKIGLVGRNGIGKTTLLQTLTQLEAPYDGDVHLADGARIGYLRQEAALAFARRDHTLYDEMLTVFARVFQWQADMHAIEHRMGDGSATDADYDRYSELVELVEFYGGYDYERRIERTLDGLGFSADDRDTPLTILSGGQKTRALLAKLLLDEPDLLILDEPTNHLDIEAIRWLEGTLQVWRGALLIVSHDRYFLDRVVNRIWEMNTIRIDEYHGNYSAYLKQRAERRERMQIEWGAMMERMWHEFNIIKARGLEDTNAKGRFRRLTREAEAISHHGIDAARFIQRKGWLAYTQQFERRNVPQTVAELERVLKSLKSPIQRQRAMRLTLEAGERSGDMVLRGRNLSIGYEAAHPLFTSDDLDVMRGDVVAVIGANGAGKSTLLKTIMQEVAPLRGHINTGASLKIGYFAQAHDGLNHAHTVIEELMEHADGMGIAASRQYLAPYLFTGEDVFKPVRSLSGGERGRLALAILAVQGANLLLLDEPTNHLDIPSQEILQDVLDQFDGTVILVTHDRYLVDRLATQIWDVQDGHLRVFRGAYHDYLAQLAREAVDHSDSAPPAPAPDPVPTVDPQAIARLEAQITAIEGEIKELETLLAAASKAGNSETIVQLSKQYKAQQKRLQELLQDWEELATEA